MLEDPFCSPSTSRAAKKSGVNDIPTGLVTESPGEAKSVRLLIFGGRWVK